MRRVFPICVSLLLFASIVNAQGAANPLDNLTPTQKVLFENEWVRAIDDQIPPGGVEPMHRHRHGVVYYLVAYKTDDTTPDGKVVHQSRMPGTAAWSNAITHSVKNVGTNTSHAIRIELKRADAPPPPAPDPLDSVKISPDTQKLLFENEYVRLIDGVMPVGATEPMHHHAHGVVVYLSEHFTVQQTSPDGKTNRTVHEKNDAAWSESISHAVQNVGTSTSHSIRVELKY